MMWMKRRLPVRANDPPRLMFATSAPLSAAQRIPLSTSLVEPLPSCTENLDAHQRRLRRDAGECDGVAAHLRRDVRAVAVVVGDRIAVREIRAP